MSQISHLGRRATGYNGNWLPVLAPSRIRETSGRNFPKEMDDYDIKRIVGEYAGAAVRCIEGGLDGLETVTGGHLIGQFLSPRTNTRSDGYGGSLRNRARFGLMVHEAIRKAIGSAIVGIRFVIDEATEGGLDFEECVELARIFESEGHIDFFNCIYGRMDTELALSEHNMPGLFQRSAPYLDKVAAFRRETKLPVMHAGGIRDVASARHVIREDVVDLVGMTRAHMADPHLVNKIIRGEEERIRPCVGASYCLYKKVNCIHNPASGRELTLSHTIEKSDVPKKIVVVGGGPAGLEASRVSAERGHSVVLYEAAAKLGGQILIAASASDRRDLIGIVDWRIAELARHGVDVRLNVYADGATVLAEKPDVIIVATGGIPDTEWLEGGDLCETVWDVLTSTVAVKDDIIVYDGTGRPAAPSCALDLARRGRAVTIVTPDDSIALEMPYQDKVGFRKRISEFGVKTVTESRLIKVERHGNGLRATFRNELTDREFHAFAAQVIIENGTIPIVDIYEELRSQSINAGVTDVMFMIGAIDSSEMIGGDGKGFALHRIGDAVASRDIYSSIYEAYRLCARI